MSLSWRLALLTAFWLWMDGYPQWQRCLRAQSQASEARARIEAYEEDLKYLPALRQRLERQPRAQPGRPPEGDPELRLTVQPARLPSPVLPEAEVSGYRIRVAGSRRRVLHWLAGLVQGYAIESLELRGDSQQVTGQLLVLEVR